MRRPKISPSIFLLLLLSFLREGTSQSTEIPIPTEYPGTTTEEYTTEEDATEEYTTEEDTTEEYATEEYTTEVPGTTTEEYTTEVSGTITEEYTTEEYTNEVPGTTTEENTTEEYTTEEYTTEEYTTEVSGTTTEEYTTEEYTTEVPGTTTEEYTTEEYTTEVPGTTTENPRTMAKPTGFLKPWQIILISLAVAALTVGLCVGLGFFLMKILHLRSPFSAAIYHPHGSNLGLSHGLSGLHHRWGQDWFWRRPEASSAMEMDRRNNMP